MKVAHRRLLAFVVAATAVLVVPQAAFALDTSRLPSGSPAPVCDNPSFLNGPSSPPAGAVRVSTSQDLDALTRNRPAGTVFWLEPGTHTFGTGQFGQVRPKDGNQYIGAPGAVIDGQNRNNFAFVGDAQNVRIAHLTIRRFTSPDQQGVVNHDQATGWTIENNTIEDNSGAGIMGGTRIVIRENCIRDNGQYGFQMYTAGDSIRDVVVHRNEISGNNQDRLDPNCGCSGGAKFWAVQGAVITDNWVHSNLGVGLWADTNNIDFLFEGNLFEDNEGQAIFYETSYNAVIRDNVFRRNALVEGPTNSGFVTGAIYISEAGGDSRLRGPGVIQISNNLFSDNHDGIAVWENSDRFCNSPHNSSSDYCTPFATKAQCSPGTIDKDPYFDDCRWKSQNVQVFDNVFEKTSGTSRNGIFANYGTTPDWSPYMGYTVPDAIIWEQGNVFTNNEYYGNWRFMARDFQTVSLDVWQSRYRQDAGAAIGVFGDVFLSNVFYDDIIWLRDQGITKGCNPPANTNFCPSSPVTRGQMAAFLVRALGLPASPTDYFDDDSSSVFENDINALAAAGITKGCTADDFCPERSVTRGEMAAFLVRALGLTDRGSKTFVDDNGSVFEGDIERLAAAGITAGCNPPANDRFCHRDHVTRGQMAAFLHRAENRF